MRNFWQLSKSSGFYAPLLAIYFVGIPVLTASRIALMLWQSGRVSATGMTWQILLQGLRVDIIQLGLMVIIPLLILPLFAHRNAWPAWRKLTYHWLVIGLVLLVFMEATTPGFVAEYDTRPNRLFIEYLRYPNEVLPMLWKGFRIHVLGVLALMALTLWLTRRWANPWLATERAASHFKHWLIYPLVLVLVIFSVRSTADHRPANPALFAITGDNMVNSLILNSSWSVLHAIYSLRHESKSSEIYGDLPLEKIMQEVQNTRSMLHDKRELLKHPKIPTLTRQIATVRRDKPLNLVIVLQESMGAGFVSSLGGKPLTPELDKLKTQGWWFERLYATGTRSVRGIEAVVAGFPPTPAQSVVKLTLAQSNFFTLAGLLTKHGYTTEFIYGGESHFDNMRGFFSNNGFQQIIDKNDYPNPSFVGSWGVSDEDLFSRTHQQLMQHHQAGKPHFTLVFTSSNHSPFEFPDGKITLYEQPKATDNNTVKYADYAMGQFFKQAQQSPYWEDTLFIIVADHDIRVRGSDLVPVEHFHIPGLILGADIKPRIIKTVASQIDLPTTALSLMGLDVEHPMIGRDISAEPQDMPGRAMMQYEQNFMWMEGSQGVILKPEKQPISVIYDETSKVLAVSNGKDTAMASRALSHVLLPSLLYREQAYRLPE